MGRIGKTFAFILTLIIAMTCLTLLMVRPSSAQTPTPLAVPVPKPSTPQFTVKFVNSSYEIPASSSINPYTGQNITSPSQQIENDSIQVIVKNQPFTPQWVQEDSSTFIDSLFYNVRMKGHFTDNWTELYHPNNLDYPLQSNSNHTLVYLQSVDYNSIPSGYKIDFQVQALIGAVHRGFNASATDQLGMYPYVFTGQMSDWSSTQTIIINETFASSSPSPNPTPTPSVPEFSWYAILPMFVSVLLIAVILRHRKPLTNNSLF
jgi:hypothetical protein